MLTALIITFFVVLWLLIMGIRIVPTGYVDAVLRFGKFNRRLCPGLSWIIPLIERAERESTQTHQLELPDEDELIDRKNDNPEPGKKRPFRILHKGMREAIFYVKRTDVPNLDPSDPKSYVIKRFHELTAQDDELRKAMEEDSLHAPLTSEVPVVVEWDLPDDEDAVRNFVSNIETLRGRTREEEVKKRMEDVAARTLQEVLGPVTPGHASERIPLFSHMLKESLEKLVGEKPAHGVLAPKPWGVHISNAYTKSINPGHQVNDARAKAGAAVSNKQATIRDAEAKAQETRLQSEANAYAESEKGKGEAARITAMAEAMKSPEAKFLAQLDVANETLHKARFIVMPSDLGVVGGILTMAEELKQKSDASPPPEKKSA